MASKHKVIITGLLIFISMQWTLSVPGKDKLYVATDFRNLLKLRMLTFRSTQLDFKDNTMTCHAVHSHVNFQFKILYVTRLN